jgi:hypothetical protein
MASAHSVPDTVEIEEKAVLCFFVEGTFSEEWTYALLLEPLGPKAKIGAVLFQKEGAKCVSMTYIRKAFDRMRDTSGIPGKAFAPPPYYEQYKKDAVQTTLDAMWTEWHRVQGDIKADALQLCRKMFHQKKKNKEEERAKIMAATPVVAVPAKNIVRRKWKLQTPVATDNSTTVGEVPTKGLTTIVTLGNRGRISSLWVRGVLKQFHGEAPCPYEIEWDTKPEPITRRMNEEQVKELVAKFKMCTKHRLFMGDVGLDLLWERDGTANSLVPTGGKRLQYGLILPYDPLMKTYKVLFRDGTYTFKNDEDLKQAKQFMENVTLGKHATWTFDDAMAAETEPVGKTFQRIPESQAAVDPSDDFNVLFGLTGSESSSASKGCAPATTTQSPKGKVRTEHTKKLPRRCAVVKTVEKFKIGTKVATTAGDNTTYPLLPKTRTGWVQGTLVRYDEGQEKRYVINWNTELSSVDSVDEDEMNVLTKNFKGCDQRRLLDVFCVGLDVLWAVVRPIPPQALKTNKHDMMWATVMFYDTKQKAYKILLRSGAEEWCTPEKLDDVIAVTQFSTLATKKQACTEAWNPNIQTVISNFGPFCVRNVGTRLRDRMTEQTSAEEPPSLPTRTEPTVRTRTKAVSPAVHAEGKNVGRETNGEKRPPTLTVQSSVEQPPKAVSAMVDPTPKGAFAPVDPKAENVPAQTDPLYVPQTTLPPGVSAVSDPAKQPTVPPIPGTPVELTKARQLELLKLKLQLAKAQSANANAKNDAAVTKTTVVTTTKRMSLTFQRESQAARKMAVLLPKASYASPTMVTITYPQTHNHTTHTYLRLLL